MPPGSSMRPTGLHHSAEGAQPPSLGTPRHRQHLDQFSPAVARLMPSGCPHRTPPPSPQGWWVHGPLGWPHPAPRSPEGWGSPSTGLGTDGQTPDIHVEILTALGSSGRCGERFRSGESGAGCRQRAEAQPHPKGTLVPSPILAPTREHSPCAWPRQRCRTRTVFAIMCCGQCTKVTCCHLAPLCSQAGKTQSPLASAAAAAAPCPPGILAAGGSALMPRGCSGSASQGMGGQQVP